MSIKKVIMTVLRPGGKGVTPGDKLSMTRQKPGDQLRVVPTPNPWCTKEAV